MPLGLAQNHQLHAVMTTRRLFKCSKLSVGCFPGMGMPLRQGRGQSLPRVVLHVWTLPQAQDSCQLVDRAAGATASTPGSAVSGLHSPNREGAGTKGLSQVSISFKATSSGNARKQATPCHPILSRTLCTHCLPHWSAAGVGVHVGNTVKHHQVGRRWTELAGLHSGSASLDRR